MSPSTSSFDTKTIGEATASFCGDKFLFKHAQGLLVCEKAVQEHAYATFTQSPYVDTLSNLFAGTLTEACVAAFGVQTTPMDLTSDIVRASRVLQYGECIFYAYSLRNIYCVRRAGGIERAKATGSAMVSEATILDVAVHDSLMVRTMHFSTSGGRGVVSLLSRLGNASESVLLVAGLLMFARGKPKFWLRRAQDDCLYLSKFELSANETFSFNSTSAYTSNDVQKLFSKRVPLSSQNTLLEHAHNYVVFVTATYRVEDIFVYVSVFDETLAETNTYGMQYAVYSVGVDRQATIVTGAYEHMSLGVEATVSATCLANGILAVSAFSSQRTATKYQTVMINMTNLGLLSTDVHPDFLQIFSAPFVGVANAVVSLGAIRTCTRCRATSDDKNSVGFFAYGAPFVTYRRLLACDKEDEYVEETLGRMPIQTCARVRQTTDQPYTYRDSVTDVKLTCATQNPLELIFVLEKETAVRFDIVLGYTGLYNVERDTRVLLYAQCVINEPVLYAGIYDNSSCVAGCPVRLISSGFRVYGAMRLESVRQRPALSPAVGLWNRRVLLRGDDVVGQRPPQHVARVWKEHSVITKTIVPTAKIEIQVLRHISVEELAAKNGRDTEQSLALDAVTIVPVLSQDLLRVARGNTSRLMTIVYVPSNLDLHTIALGSLAYGDDNSDWARVHAAVRVVSAERPAAQCLYAARLVSVDDNLQVIDEMGATGTLYARTGCVFDLARSPLCHIELPRSLVNNASIVGLEIVALTSTCDILSEQSDVTVELSPFMKISQCPAEQFLDAHTLACTACDDGEPYCPAGRHVEGCLAMIHPLRAKTCLRCLSPNGSYFPNSSHGCDKWLCPDGYFRSDGLCARCTSALAVGATGCYNEAGKSWQACSAFTNEQCVDCVTKPRYSQWTVSGTRECTWLCKDAFFESSGICEACLTFDEVVATLAFGARAAGAFYRFRPCNSTTQATAEKCSARDFALDLNGTYSADAATFGSDCMLDCAQDSNTHSVRANVTRGDFQWNIERCKKCPQESWPLFFNGTLLPRQAFRMSESCTATCVNSRGFVTALNYTGVCLFCPAAACGNGTFWSSADNCSVCHACTKKYAGSVFHSAGALDDALSCVEHCPLGSYRREDNTCRTHSLLACTPGLQYAVAGTPLLDAVCGTCADCSGARVTLECTLTTNRQCASCGAINAWSSFWSRTGCEVLCRTEDGYTKLTTADGVTCRKCKVCALGYARPPTPSNCTCQPCDVGIPAKAIYTKGCTWTCPLYHIARLDAASGSMVCEYTVKQASNERYSLRAVSPVTCPNGQRLTHDARPGAYASLLCETCATPAGLHLAQVNATWIWDRGCAWRCAWNLQKQQTLGLWRCEALVYTHSGIPAVHIRKYTTSSFTGMHALALALSALVVVVFAFCCFRKMLHRDKEL